MTAEKAEVDENLYSRQIYVLGVDAMKKLAKATILISGMGGLGVEIAKNVILAGPKSVTLHDTKNATIRDLSSQFYLTPNSIGKNRALESYLKLAELNEYVSISATTNELTKDFIRQFNCLIITEPMGYNSLLELSEFCHKSNIYFIIAVTRGVYGLIFDDFGDDFFVREPSSEKPTRFLIESISNDEKGIVTTNRKELHGLSNQDHVVFNQIEGMTELNGKEFPVNVINSTSFSIGDTSSFHPFETGSNSGYGTQIILPVTMHFKELKEAIKEPIFVEYDFLTAGRNEQVLLCFLSLFKSIEENDTSFENVLKNASLLNSELHISSEGVQEQFLREFVREDCEISPTDAVVGGLAAQESIKSVSSKFLPLRMFYTMAYTEALQPIDDPSFTVTLHNDRYDAYRLVFGDAQFEKMSQLRYFMVGSGALGCELLKNWAMMGVATKGMIFVTDMDQIERSNLNRQFLFRNADIGKSKSECAARAVKSMNPDINIQAQQNMVGPESENIYNDSFYTSLSGVCNALDNVEARSYNDSQCVYYNKPLLESGTLGPLAHFQTFVPHLTQSYNSFPAARTKGIPECTLHYFPTNINHCTMWALDVFGGLFTIQPRVVDQYINDKGYVKRMMKDDPGALVDNLKTVKNLLVDKKPADFNDCIKLARLKFNEIFDHSIRDLIHLHPKDSLDNDGSPFWTEGHIFPTIITFDPTNPLHQSFISSCAFMYAKMYKIIDQNEAYKEDPNLAQIAAQVEVPEWTPSEQPDDKKKKKGHVMIIKTLCKAVSATRLPENELVSEEFEKDNPINGHVDFIAAAANLRAANYRIKAASTIEIKGIAGNIIPAIATTTAAVCGFVSLEMYKVHSVHPKEIDAFRDGYMNIADFSLQLLPPNPASKRIVKPTLPGDGNQEIYFTLWDKWVIEGDLTVKQFIEEFQKKYRLEVSTMAVGMILVYAGFFPNTKQFADRKITDIYQKEAELKLIPGKMLKLTVGCDDKNGQEIQIPEIYLKYD